jgi:hypothetical protein
MRLGWFLSLLAHVAFICAGLIVWPHAAKSLDVESAIVPIEVINFSAQSNITPIASPDAATAPQALIEGAPQDVSKAAEPEAVPALSKAQPKAPPKKPAPQKLDLDKLALLIDRAKKAPGNAAATTSPNGNVGEKPRQGFGAQSGLTASIADYLASVFERCWRSPADMPNPERLIVTVRVTLNRDGTLAASPGVVSAVLPGDAPMRVAADNALRAVRTCGPYKLPADSYADWREMDLRFGVKGLIQ